MPKNKKNINKHRKHNSKHKNKTKKYNYSSSSSSSNSSNSNINNNDGRLFDIDSNESDNDIDFFNDDNSYNYEHNNFNINDESDESSNRLNDNDKVFRDNNLNQMIPILSNDINNNNNLKSKYQIKLLKNNPYVKNNSKLIKKLNKDLNISNSIENEYIKKIINKEEREDFYRNCNIKYEELKENNSLIPPRLKNIIENLNYFSSVNVNVDDIIENDKTNILIRNISLPYEQIINSILDEKCIDTDCLVCAFNGFKSTIIDSINQKLNEHIYSKNFCAIIASLFVSCYANDLIKKSNKISKNLINKEKHILGYFDNEKNLIKNWTPASVLYHIKYHMDDPIIFKKLTIRDLKHQNENLKKNGLHKTFSEPKKGIEDNVIMDYKAHDAYMKNINMMIKLYNNNFEVNTQYQIEHSMLIHKYSKSQKKKKTLTCNDSFTQTFLNNF